MLNDKTKILILAVLWCAFATASASDYQCPGKDCPAVDSSIKNAGHGKKTPAGKKSIKEEKAKVAKEPKASTQNANLKQSQKD
jgi:hypothetical protein